MPGDDHDDSVRVRLLGPLEISDRGRDCTPTAPKVRQVLSMLLLRCNHTVAADSLIYELWGEMPPPSAVTTLQTYVYHLRKIFERERLSSGGEMEVVTRSPGYCLRVDRDAIDVSRFEVQVRTARGHMERSEWSEAATRLRRGLDMWTGCPLGNVDLGPQLTACVDQMQEARKEALHLRIDAEMQMGRYSPLLAELRSLVATYPFDEWLHGCLMRALERSGRRSEALAVYRDLRTTMNVELGLDPSSEVQGLHQELLADGSRR